MSNVAKTALGCSLSISLFGMLVLPVWAAVTGFSDLMGSQLTSALSNHTISFTTQAGAAEGATIAISFATAFDTSIIDFTDIDLAVGGTDRTLAANCTGTEQISAAVANDVITFTVCVGDGGAIAASSAVTVEIGTNATSGVAGDQQIRNPAAAGSYTIAIGGTFGDRGQISVVATSPGAVTVTGVVGSGQSSGGTQTTGGQTQAGDTTAPTVSNIQVQDITRTSARVTWITDEVSNSFVDLGQTVSYEIGTSTDASMVTSHSVSLTTLTDDTLYHFRVRSRDATGNQATSTDATFRTLPAPDTSAPVITDIQTLNITGTSATVAWATNEASTSIVEYGLTTGYEIPRRENATLVLDHALNLTGLTGLTTYHYRVRSSDGAGNEAVSTDRTFQTADNVAPVISAIATVDITQNTARVTWSTDEDADSSVSYGTTVAYTAGTITDAIRVRAHSVSLAGLLPATTYHFEIRSRDVAGNTAISPDQIFTTAPDQTAPANVSGFSGSETAPGEIGLTWTNPPDADFAGLRILRRTDGVPQNPTDGVIIFDGRATSAVDGNRPASTAHFYAAFAYDTSGNFASGALTQVTTAAREGEPPPPPPPPPGVICGNAQCETGETVENCPADCQTGQPAPRVPVCGDAICEPPETTLSCAADCALALPPPTVGPGERIAPNTVQVAVASGTLPVTPTDSVFPLIDESVVRVTLPVEDLPREPTEVVLRVGPSIYRLNRTDNAFTTDIVAPQAGETAPVAVSITYPDGTADRIDRQFTGLPAGRVVTRQDATFTPVPRALITLLDATLNVWDPSPYREQNPLFTDDQGAYFWYVPNGTYTLRIEREGFRTETQRLRIANNIVNSQIELILLPPPVIDSAQEILSSETTTGEKARALADLAVDQARYGYEIARVEVLDNPQIETAAEIVAAPTLTAITVVSAGAAATTAAGAVNVLNLARFLFTQPLLFFSRRKRKGFGVVYNAITKMPVDLAVVRLKDAATGRIMQTRVTDRGGRYFFIVQPGKYLIDAHKASFVFPTQYLKTQKQDALFLDLYHGESVEVTEKNATVSANIPLDPEVKERLPAQILRKLALQKAEFIISTVSPIIALAAVIIQPTPVTIGLFGAQVVAYGGLRVLAKPRKLKGWGLVTDEKTGQPLEKAIVRIFEPVYNKLLEMQITDNRGRYSSLVGPNVYRVVYEKEGFDPFKIESLDYRDKKEPTLIKEDVRLKSKSVFAPPTGEWREEPI